MFGGPYFGQLYFAGELVQEISSSSSSSSSDEIPPISSASSSSVSSNSLSSSSASSSSDSPSSFSSVSISESSSEVSESSLVTVSSSATTSSVEESSVESESSLVPPPGSSSSHTDESGDIVIEQEERSYDAGGNLVQVTLRQRFHDDGNTPGPLGDVDTNPKARVTYQAMWPDAIGRVRSTADYGTNGSLTLERPGVAPERSDTVLVNTTRFASDGQPSAQIGPDGVETRWTNDAAGRRIKLIENYVPEGSCAGADGNRTTEYAYNADGQLSQLTLRNNVTGDQLTRWVYGTTLEDSEIARMDLLRAKIYPESDDTADPLGNGADEVYERIEYSYNAQGQMLTMKDANGTVHAYVYDDLGRMLHDRVTTLADGVDDAVLRISRSYEPRGMVAKVTSYDDATVGSGSVVNEVEMLYDSAGNLAEDRQSADGAVDALTTPAVHYGYATSENLTTRLLSVALVNGAPLTRQYDYRYDASEIDDALGRVSAIGINGETGDKVAYTYVGAGRVVEVGYPEPDLTLSYIKAPGEPVGDAGDPYTGYDRFGRTEEMTWRQGVAGTIVDRFGYGYNRASNRRWKQQLAAPAGGQDEYYRYDGLQQVRSFERGNVNLNRTAVDGVPAQAEGFEYDPTGNWERYQKMANGANELDQTRTHNRDNQMIEIAGSASGINYDLAGNATLLPPTEGGDWEDSYQLVWDAWQRLVAIKSGDGTTTISTYGYDGQARRLLRTVGGVATQCLYNKDWKAFLDWEVADAAATRKAYFWGAMHRDELVLRDRDASDSLDERLYVTHDYYSPTAITDATGEVKERYAYSAFGVRRIMDAEFTTINSSEIDWDFGFQGQFRDEESEFYNYGYRFYSPYLGRWLSRDPIGEYGGDNIYIMVKNSPTNYIDHLGLELKKYASESATPKYIPGGGGEFYGATTAKWVNAVQTKVSGTTLHIDGEMVITIEIYNASAKDEQGRDTLTHERQHEVIYAAWRFESLNKEFIERKCSKK